MQPGPHLARKPAPACPGAKDSDEEELTRSFRHLNMNVYGTMQGPNEFVVNGTFRDWDRRADLRESRLPTLLSVGRHDTMKVADIGRMGKPSGAWPTQPSAGTPPTSS